MKRATCLRAITLLLCGLPAAGFAAEPALAAVNCLPTGDLRGNAAQGAALHLKHCAECHGVDGKGDAIVMHMDVPPKDQSDTDYMKTLSDEFLYLAVCKGGEAVGRNFIMPAWGDLLSDQDIKDLVAQIRTFSGT
jgi:cytochrome c oxidase cbb3-type subunit 3